MKIMHCPMNGPRNVSEFVYGGVVENIPDTGQCSDREWAEYLFIQENKKGIVREWWFHLASAYWFIAERDTATNKILKTYPSTELFQPATGSGVQE